MKFTRRHTSVPVTVDVKHELSGLHDFQRHTAAHVFDRLFGSEDPTSRFLVADEVGLGKTMVARGVIVQSIAHLQREGNARINVVYICSNQAIAKQNLRKLAPSVVPTIEKSDRLSMLPFRMPPSAVSGVNLIALTPGTSLAPGMSGGQLSERAAIFAALKSIWHGGRLSRSGMGNLFAGHHIGRGQYQSINERFRNVAADYKGMLSPQAKKLFNGRVAMLDKKYQHEWGRDLHSTLRLIAGEYEGSDDFNPPDEVRRLRNRVMRDLRSAMSTVGAELLKPDLIVLDEFQRFRHILHETTAEAAASDSYAADVARSLFDFHHHRDKRDARILLLSATPYAMHTTAADAEDDHYRDFLETYQFLAAGLAPGSASTTEGLSRSLYRLRRAIADVGVAGVGPAHEAADDVSRLLRQVMVRTERLAATPDRDGMLTTIDENTQVPGPDALRQFRSVSTVVNALWAPKDASPSPIGEVVNYWKAAPYTLSYLANHYRVLPNLDDIAGPESPSDGEALQLLQGPGAGGYVPWDAVRDYQEVPASHGALSSLWSDFFEKAQAERLLWLPASLPYYSAGGGFETAAATGVTKRLIFSSWKLAPTAITTLTSYEAERRLRIERGTGDRYDSRPKSGPLRFGQNSASMSHLLFDLVLPSLADLLDPLSLSIDLRKELGRLPTLDEIHQRAAAIVVTRIGATNLDLPPASATRGSTAWYPLAATLISADAEVDGYEMAGIAFDDAVADPDEEFESTDDSSHLDEHLDELARMTDPQARPDFVPHDLAEVVAWAGIASPPLVMYRALKRSFPDATADSLTNAARRAGTAMRRLLNRQNGVFAVHALVSEADVTSEDEYWRRALHYCALGNLQSVMDEFVAALVEHQGLHRTSCPDGSHCRNSNECPDCGVEAAGEAISRIISLKASRYSLRTMSSGLDQNGDDDGHVRWRTNRMRVDFAVPLSEDSVQDGRSRSSNEVTEAFNSPFWPFIVASTSIGQEGLDFHLYSHAVTHWNLPTNPVDLEQREGRVHRYKGHAVRKNIARSMPFPAGSDAPWAELYSSAVAARDSDSNDMVPYWVFAPASLGSAAAKIERHMPVTPYTREMSFKDDLIASVATYRMAFGQPRQDELLSFVLADLPDDIRKDLAEVRIDLNPPVIPRD